MSDLSSIGLGLNGLGGSVGPVNRLSPSTPIHNRLDQLVEPLEPTASSAADVDRVELSDFARYLDMLRQLPNIRQNLVDLVKSQIDAGTYETDDKIDAAIELIARDEI
jgi:hypothetical protein